MTLAYKHLLGLAMSLPGVDDGKRMWSKAIREPMETYTLVKPWLSNLDAKASKAEPISSLVPNR